MLLVGVGVSGDLTTKGLLGLFANDLGVEGVLEDP